jgi:hypothetical protein
MRLLPLAPSARLPSCLADTQRVQEALPSILERDSHTCRFCGFHAAGSQEVVLLDAASLPPSPDTLATACLLCAAVQQLDRPTAGQETLVIWMPEMAQAVLNALVRGIHLALHTDDESPVLGSRPRQDTPTTRAAWSAYDALAARREAAELHIGTSSPRELAAALLEMSRASCSRRAALLGGVRVLHRGRHIRDGQDAYPEILADWAAAASPEATAMPAFPTLS